MAARRVQYLSWLSILTARKDTLDRVLLGDSFLGYRKAQVRFLMFQRVSLNKETIKPRNHLSQGSERVQGIRLSIAFVFEPLQKGNPQVYC